MIAPLLAVLLGCGADLEAVPGTTARLDTPSAEVANRRDLSVRVFRDADTCAAVVHEVDACVPWMDRATGQVRVAFRLELDGQPKAAALTEENVEIFHKSQQVKEEGEQVRVAIVPHDPERTPRLFVLVIDASGSMAIDDEGKGTTRMDLLRAALTRRDVVDAFFGTGSQNAVIPLVFSGEGPPRPLGGRWVVSSGEEWAALVRDQLTVSSGYTHLYQAVEFATSALFDVPEVARALTARTREPVVIALTDGFNNHGPDDVCATNAPRLERLLAHLDEVRRGPRTSLERRPLVFTVGLGRAAWRNVPVIESTSVRASQICKGFGDVRIDGELERAGVDNAALDRIARTGGGSVFIRRDTRGLAEAFKAAAATRYAWFEARYQVDPFHLRRSFETRLRLLTAGGPTASLVFQPSGWIDGPPGVPDSDGWTRRAPLMGATVVALGFVAAFVVLAYLPAAVVNAARLLRGRVRI